MRQLVLLFVFLIGFHQLKSQQIFYINVRDSSFDNKVVFWGVGQLTYKTEKTYYGPKTSIVGAIKWTVVSSDPKYFNGYYNKKINASAIEYVEGEFDINHKDKETGRTALRVRGRSKEDPDKIIDFHNYEMLFLSDGSVKGKKADFSGLTGSDQEWKGTLKGTYSYSATQWAGVTPPMVERSTKYLDSVRLVMEKTYPHIVDSMIKRMPYEYPGRENPGCIVWKTVTSSSQRTIRDYNPLDQMESSRKETVYSQAFELKNKCNTPVVIVGISPFGGRKDGIIDFRYTELNFKPGQVMYSDFTPGLEKWYFDTEQFYLPPDKNYNSSIFLYHPQTISIRTVGKK